MPLGYTKCPPINVRIFTVHLIFFVYSQAVRLQLERWGIDNVNDLIVDETVDEFDPPKPSTEPPLPMQPNLPDNPNTNQDPRNQLKPQDPRDSQNPSQPPQNPSQQPQNPPREPLNPPQDPRGFERPKKPPQRPAAVPKEPPPPKPPQPDPNDPRNHQQPPNRDEQPFVPDVPNTVYDGGYDYPNPNDKPELVTPPIRPIPIPLPPPSPPLPTHPPPTVPPPLPIGGYIPTFIHFNDIDGFWRSAAMQQPPVAVSTISFLIHNQRWEIFVHSSFVCVCASVLSIGSFRSCKRATGIVWPQTGSIVVYNFVKAFTLDITSTLLFVAPATYAFMPNETLMIG